MKYPFTVKLSPWWDGVSCWHNFGAIVPSRAGSAVRGCPANNVLLTFCVILHKVHCYTYGQGVTFPWVRSKVVGCKSNQNFLHCAMSSLPPFASILRQPLINMTWCHSSWRVFLYPVVSFHRTACVVELEEGIFMEEADICKSLRSDGTLHKKRKEAKFIGKETR